MHDLFLKKMYSVFYILQRVQLKSHGAANQHDCYQIFLFTKSTEETEKKIYFFLSKLCVQMKGLHSVYFGGNYHCLISFRFGIVSVRWDCIGYNLNQTIMWGEVFYPIEDIQK